MKYIDEEKIKKLLQDAQLASPKEIKAILDKSKSLKRLSLKEAAALLAVKDKKTIKNIRLAASFVKDAIYGRRIVLFAPLYISNVCANKCLYCAFQAGNAAIKRKALSIEEIKEQTRWLLGRGHKRILMVAAEAEVLGKSNADYYVEAIKAIYEVSIGQNRIKRVNINCAPLSVEEFRLLKSSGIGTYQIFQETYHEVTYRKVHPQGPKNDPDNRIDAIDRAFTAGIDDVGIGVLYGLYDYKFDALAMLMHIEHLEDKFNVGPHTISVPRIEPALGVSFSENMPYKVSDEEFKNVVAILRLSIPYTGMILSTREQPRMRDELFGLGVSQASAESRTSPGGYSSNDASGQFILSDERTLDEIIGKLIEKKFIPSFCAACYRKSRTGEAFMSLAKPGHIKDKCNLNALITLKEYLDDFASLKVKKAGYKLIDSLSRKLDKKSHRQFGQFLEEVNKGARDLYI